MASRLQDVLLRGLAAARPAATAVANGTLYFATDTGLVTQSDGTTWAAYSAAAAVSSVVTQVVTTTTGALTSGTTVIPTDNTIPQITEGNEYLTLAVTPTSATHRLVIEVILVAAPVAANHVSVALFKDATANALAATATYVSVAHCLVTIPLRYQLISGTTSAITFRVRAGVSSGSAGLWLNGAGGTGVFGGVMASRLTITELTP